MPTGWGLTQDDGRARARRTVHADGRMADGRAVRKDLSMRMGASLVVRRAHRALTGAMPQICAPAPVAPAPVAPAPVLSATLTDRCGSLQGARCSRNQGGRQAGEGIGGPGGKGSGPYVGYVGRWADHHVPGAREG